MRAPIETTNPWDPLNQDTSEGKGRRSMAKRNASSARIVALPDADDDSFREQSYLKTVKPRTANQEALMTAIDAHSLTLAVGPAGTGKTYLAVTKAVEAMNAGRISRIVITRPVVEAGESLGFLPGDINEKMDPWMRPIYDALSDRLGARQVRQMTKDGTVEIAPLAYMRGRTISRSFVIVDEAQNMTFQQIKMLLTRLGWHSTMVITGDPDQTDLLPGMSGLEEAVRRLQPLEDIAIVRLTTQDIVRHPLVAAMMPLLA
jgi:phosphate starvation-inducible PhoH-like protein